MKTICQSCAVLLSGDESSTEVSHGICAGCKEQFRVEAQRFCQKETVQDILTMALQTPKRIADVFVEFFPHVNWIDVRVFAGGWDGQKEPEKFTSRIEETEYESIAGLKRDLLAHLALLKKS